MKIKLLYYPSFLFLMITNHIYHLFIVLCDMPTFIGVIMYAYFYIVVFFLCINPTPFGCYENKAIIIPPPNEVGGGVYWIHLVRPSVRPSVCRRHGFRSISQVSFELSISNFICMLMVAIGRSLLIFSDVTFKMAAWRPYWIFWFPDSNFTLALNINFKLQRHNTYVYG